MNYIKVKWIHQFKNEPVELYSELDDNRNETRKIEVFNDDQIGYATLEKKVGDTRDAMAELINIVTHEAYHATHRFANHQNNLIAEEIHAWNMGLNMSNKYRKQVGMEIKKKEPYRYTDLLYYEDQYKIKYNPEKFTELGK